MNGKIPAGIAVGFSVGEQTKARFSDNPEYQRFDGPSESQTPR
jgi:hypothetical protein